MKREALIITGLIAITLLAFSGVRTCQFTNFDDPTYIINNRHVLGGLTRANFVWAWKTFYEGNYIPLTWVSLMVDASLFGKGPLGFHLVNLGFHVANTVLLYLFFRQATGAVWRSALVAAIFAVHPLRVESVVWAVERKDVLTDFFGLLTMLAYLRFARKPNWGWYAVIMGLFAATLLAKQILATLPCVLLLLDYWPLGRWTRGPLALGPELRPRRSLPILILEKLPLIAMSAIILTVTMRAQASTNTVANLDSVPLHYRLTNVPVAYARYLGKMVWFGNLAVLYPPHRWKTAPVVWSTLLLAAITLLCLWKSRKSPWLIIGWLWFVGVLVPMIGVVQFGPQSMADRFTYFSGIGLLVMVVWSIPESVLKQPVPILATVVGTVLALLMLFTYRQTGYWKNSVTLFAHDIRVAGRSQIAETNLGSGLVEKGKMEEGIRHLRSAEAMDDKHALTQFALGLALAYNNQTDEAMQHIQKAIDLRKDDPNCRVALAFCYLHKADYDEAIEACREAIRLDVQVQTAEAYHILGIALCRKHDYDDGIAQFRKAISINPDLNSARRDLEKFEIERQHTATTQSISFE